MKRKTILGSVLFILVLVAAIIVAGSECDPEKIHECKNPEDLASLASNPSYRSKMDSSQIIILINKAQQEGTNLDLRGFNQGEIVKTFSSTGYSFNAREYSQGNLQISNGRLVTSSMNLPIHNLPKGASINVDAMGKIRVTLPQGQSIANIPSDAHFIILKSEVTFAGNSYPVDQLLVKDGRKYIESGKTGVIGGVAITAPPGADIEVNIGPFTEKQVKSGVKNSVYINKDGENTLVAVRQSDLPITIKVPDGSAGSGNEFSFGKGDTTAFITFASGKATQLKLEGTGDFKITNGPYRENGKWMVTPGSKISLPNMIHLISQEGNKKIEGVIYDERSVIFDKTDGPKNAVIILAGEKIPFSLPGETTPKSSAIINFAKKFLGQGYSWGVFDCSKFVQTVFAEYGIELPRTSHAQFKTGEKILDNRNLDLSRLVPGDILYFKYTSSRTGLLTGHVGIYLGNGQFIHNAASSGVTISDISNNRYYQSIFYGATRVLPSSTTPITTVQTTTYISGQTNAYEEKQIPVEAESPLQTLTTEKNSFSGTCLCDDKNMKCGDNCIPSQCKYCKRS